MSQLEGQATWPRLGGFSIREISIMIALMGPTTMVLVDNGMVGVALPVIQADFNVSVDLLSWVMAIGFLVPVPLMPIYGRVGDVFGKKYLYLIGLAIFVVGALFGAVAPSFGWLIWGRLLQGFGSASSLPLAMALIVEAFPQDRRGRALGIWNASAPAGIILGPVLGGVIVEEFGWHTTFVIVAALALASLSLVAWLVPRPPRPTTRPRVDWFGAIALAVTIGSLLLATTTASVVPFGSVLNLLFWGLAGVGVLSLIWNMSYRPRPFIGFDVLRNRQFVTPTVAVSLRMFAHDGARFLMVLYLANVFSQSPRDIGFFMLFYAVPLMIGVAYGGFLADRWPNRIVGFVGMVGLAAGMLWISLVNPNIGSFILAPGLSVAGLTAGISLTPFTKTAVVALGPDRVGLAAGLYNTLRFAGLAASTPLLGLLLVQGFAQHNGLETVSGPYQLGFQLLAVIAVLGSAAATLIPTDTSVVQAGEA